MKLDKVQAVKKYHIVYATINLKNSKLYIGRHSTDNLEDGYLGSGKILNKAIKKYGKEVFAIDILEFYDTFEKCCKGEKFWIRMFKMPNKISNDVYNISDGGEGNLGYTHTNETKLKISAPGESNPMFGKKHKESTKELIRVKRLKNLESKEFRTRMIKVHADVSGNKNPFYGKHHSEETKKKIGLSNMGKKRSKGILQKIEINCIG